MLDGTTKELNLPEMLDRARDIREIRHSSPLVTIALHRLALCILHRNFGPRERDDWRALWSNGGGHWDMAVIQSYFVTHRSAFDIFDEDHPFYQVADIPGARRSPISRLYHELASGNNTTLFDHSLDLMPTSVSAAEAACVLVTHQAFAVGGGRSPSGYTTSAPLIGSVAVLVRGQNLFETLMLNLIRYAPEYDDPIPCQNDRPAWESQEPLNLGSKRRTRGYLDLLTWQSRGIRLLPEGPPDNPQVSQLLYAQGVTIDDELIRDPQVPAYKDDKRGERRLRLSPERALWRDSAALLNLSKSVGRPVQALEWLSHFVDDCLNESALYNLNAFGLATDKAKILLWREEELPLPLRYLEKPDLANTLGDEITRAEKGARALQQALRTLARHVLYPDNQSRVDPDQVRRYAGSFHAEQVYWSRLGFHFLRLVPGLADDVERAQRAWVEAVRHDAIAAMEETLKGLGTSARVLKAATKARAVLYGEMAVHVGRREESGVVG
jgi:CRISPR system Cascade subunit CasA